ncbi:MAG: endonuclease/exonuclease/phosphatase family protein [Planctomycetota bacterium]|nr:endonuclease/exonuclease/phosphatase family protein [Planctomycetota bacterium]MDA1251823.1 endonuclease/exonuclease/phosphatase family protein [Planctomycetota bacterium]
MSATTQNPTSPWATQTPYRRQPTQREIEEKQQRRFSRWTLWASVLNVLFTMALVVSMLEVSENWWLTGTLIFVPQLPLLIPSICLLVASLVFNIRAALLNVACLGLVLFSLCGAGFSMKAFDEVPNSARNIRVLSCNVQNFQPDFSKVMREVSRAKPDIVAFQEARDTPPEMLTQFLKGWHFQHVGEFWVGSRWPINLVGSCGTTPYDNRLTALKVQVETPNGPVVLSNVHLMTARRGLANLSLASIVSGEGPAAVEHHAFLRYEEARQTRQFIDKSGDDVPHLIVGDFNMPATSNILDEHFGSFRNAFDEAGFGFGYTAPCRPVRFWIPNTPWLRIDHVLSSNHFEPLQCSIGELNGSDHRLVSSVLKLKTGNEPPP